MERTACERRARRAASVGTRGVVPAVLAAVLALAVGCGSDDGAGTSGADASDVADPSTPSAASSSATPDDTGPPDSAPAGGATLPTRPSADPEPSQGGSPTPAGGDPVSSDRPVFEPGDIDTGLRPFVDDAVADLAVRLDVDPADIELLTAVLVVWPNSALGCPDPKMSYAQVPVDGSVIELGVGERVYRYHTGGASELFLCERPWSDSAANGGPSAVVTAGADTDDTTSDG
jgi:hypothetical protein